MSVAISLASLAHLDESAVVASAADLGVLEVLHELVKGGSVHVLEDDDGALRLLHPVHHSAEGLGGLA